MEHRETAYWHTERIIVMLSAATHPACPARQTLRFAQGDNLGNPHE
ncbi:MAG TPA: hypothetical protein VF844_16075 [Ktedonobacteraceae bacterium]